MKKILNTLFRYFGWKPLFGMKSVVKTKENISLEDTRSLLTAWLNNALKIINAELQKQITMNGFDPDKIRSGLLILTRELLVDPADDNVKHETYRIGNIEILRVTWKINGFTMHVRPRQDSKDIKKMITKFAPEGKIIEGKFSKEDVAITERARKMVEEFERSPEPNIRNPKA